MHLNFDYTKKTNLNIITIVIVLVIISITSVSVFQYSRDNKFKALYVPINVGDVLFYDVSYSRNAGIFFSTSEDYLWKVEVISIGTETNNGTVISLKLSEFKNNLLYFSTIQQLFIPKSKTDFYNASPYIFFTNRFFDMAEGSTLNYFHGYLYQWYKNGSSFSEHMIIDFSQLITSVTYCGGILYRFQYQIREYLTVDAFSLKCNNFPNTCSLSLKDFILIQMIPFVIAIFLYLYLPRTKQNKKLSSVLKKTHYKNHKGLIRKIREHNRIKKRIKTL